MGLEENLDDNGVETGGLVDLVRVKALVLDG